MALNRRIQSVVMTIVFIVVSEPSLKRAAEKHRNREPLDEPILPKVKQSILAWGSRQRNQLRDWWDGRPAGIVEFALLIVQTLRRLPLRTLKWVSNKTSVGRDQATQFSSRAKRLPYQVVENINEWYSRRSAGESEYMLIAAILTVVAFSVSPEYTFKELPNIELPLSVGPLRIVALALLLPVRRVVGVVIGLLVGWRSNNSLHLALERPYSNKRVIVTSSGALAILVIGESLSQDVTVLALLTWYLYYAAFAWAVYLGVHSPSPFEDVPIYEKVGRFLNTAVFLPSIGYLVVFGSLPLIFEPLNLFSPVAVAALLLMILVPFVVQRYWSPNSQHIKAS